MHTLFLQEVESSYEHVAAAAWKGYNEAGRGSVFVHHGEWMNVIRKDWDNSEEAFPHEYVPFGETIKQMELGPLNHGLLQILAEYNPEKQVVLCVRHHPGKTFGAYLISSEPGPREAFAAMYPDEEERR